MLITYRWVHLTRQSCRQRCSCGNTRPHAAQVLKLLELPAADMAVFTSSPVEARIHVGFMGKDLLPESLIEKIKDGPWTHIVAFRPTGGGTGLCPRQGSAAIATALLAGHGTVSARHCMLECSPGLQLAGDSKEVLGFTSACRM